MQDTQEGYEEENPKSKSNWKQAAVIHVKAGSEPEGRRQNPQKTLQKVTQEEKYKENTRKLLFYMPYIYISSSFLWILVLNMPIYVAEFIRIFFVFDLVFKCVWLRHEIWSQWDFLVK